MNTGNYDTKKYIIILISVCIIFIILTTTAFDKMSKTLPNMPNEEYNGYYPNSVNNTEYQNNAGQNVIADEKYNNNEEIDKNENINSENDERHKSGHIDFMQDYSNKENNLEEIPAPLGTNEESIQSINNKPEKSSLSEDEIALKHIVAGKNYISSNTKSEAIQEYLKAADIAKTNEIKAMAYEALAEIYASQRRFGTALSYASKANNLAPSNTRELLITKINNSAGRVQE